MKKFTKSIIFSTTLVMAATSQAQQMEEHEHKGSDKPETLLELELAHT
jgi:hypothetical protein